MDQLEKLLKLLIAGGILLAICKVLIFYGTLKLRNNNTKRKPLDAAEVIKCGGMHPEAHKKMLKDMIIDRSRDEDIENAYKVLRNDFKFKLQSKQLTRGQILGIEEYLRNQLNDKRKFNDNAHAIYSLLKSTNLTLEHISTISKFIA